MIANREGKPLSKIRQGEEAEMIITAKVYGEPVSGCLLASPLPGGFEMVLPRTEEDPLPENVERMDRREDGMILFAAVDSSFRYSYRIRAVNRGVFTVPAATVEAMYDRSRHARSASAVITVE